MFILISMADNTTTHRDPIKDTVYERFIFTVLANPHPTPPPTPHWLIQAKRQEVYVDLMLCVIVKQTFILTSLRGEM